MRLFANLFAFAVFAIALIAVRLGQPVYGVAEMLPTEVRAGFAQKP